MPAGRDSRRSSKPGPASNEIHKSSSDRRLKAKSNQAFDERRRRSQQTDGGLNISTERPGQKTRTNSAPLVQTINEPGYRAAVANGEKAHASDVECGAENGQDEDEVAGVVGAVKRFQPFQNTEPDINIAVIGADRVGKSTFVQNALDLPFLSDSHAVERKIELDGSDYLLRLLEISIDDIEIDQDDGLNWPDSVEDKIMPPIHGALTLYDVTNEGSLENLPELLTAIHKTGIPLLLVACKCDAPPEERDLNPRVIEQSAKRKVEDLDTLRVFGPENYKQGVSKILRAIIPANPEEASDDQIRSLSPSRRRAQSSSVLSSSAQPRSDRGHLRATSEWTGGMYKDQWHRKHDSKLAGYNSNDRLKVHLEISEEDMRGSFLIEESTSEASDESSRASEDMAELSVAALKPSLSSSEEGVTFDELVDRLLALPMSKADNKFVAVFLALYRKFAAPGQLLEAIAQRFDDLERQRDGCMIKTIAQLRYLSILERWVGTYPGDFAYPKTQRRMRTFVGKLSQSRMFSAAAKEISAYVHAAHEDDDTHWAYCDQDRTNDTAEYRISVSSTASTLIDDASFGDGFLLAETPLEDDTKTLGGGEDETIVSMSSSPTFSHHTANVETAQRQANLLHPIPRHPVSKIQWRALMDLPDELVAREMTRIDWIMFCSIRPRDLVRQVSLTKQQRAECKNLIYVDRMTEHFNHVAFWVENYILLRDKPKHRALMLEKFMRIARKLREVNNYNALGAIIAGIKSTAVHRLAATRELIPPAVGKDWMKLEILMSPSRSYSAYRLAWENSSTERIPYLPLHRRDLVSAEAGNKTFIGDEKDGKINWKKFDVIGEVIVSLQNAQSVPYVGLSEVRGNQQLKELVLDAKLVKDEDELFARSKQVEPSGTPATGTTAKFKELFKR